MNAKKVARELERQVEREPTNLALRLRLAAAFRTVGRREEATTLVRSVAATYHAEGRLAQALAVCRSLLEIEPDDLPTRALFAELEVARTGASAEEPTQWNDGTGRRPTPLPPQLPVVEAAPEDYEIDDDTGPRTRPRADTADPADPSDPPPDPAEDDDPITSPSVDTLADPAALPFVRLPGGVQREIAERRHRRRYRPGDIIVREGELGESCFVLASGTVRVVRRDAEHPGEAAEVARLGPGELFGEFALLADRRRHATVQAIDRVDAFEIPRKALRELAAANPAVAVELERLYRERLLANLLVRAPFFRMLPAEKRRALAMHFAPCRYEAGQPIVREGERGGAFYLVVLGAVEVTRRAGNRGAVLLATLSEGQYFGELSMAGGAVCSATVTAAGPTELAELPRRDFFEILSSHPTLLEERRGDLGAANIVAGETTLV